MKTNFQLQKPQQAYISEALSRAGIVGQFFMSAFPERVDDVILLGEPIRQEENFSNALEKEIHNSPRHVLFFNECARLGDPSLSWKSGIVNVQDEVYHLLLPQATRNQIQAGIIEAETGFAFGIIFHPSDEDVALLLCGNVSKDVIIRCASSATHIIVGVYDGESYLMCRLRSIDMC
jgi:hypothetical protein